MRNEIHTSDSGSNPRRQSSTTQGCKSSSYGITNVSIPEVKMLKNSSTVAVSVPINLSIKLGFVSVKRIGKTYFVNALRTLSRGTRGNMGTLVPFQLQYPFALPNIQFYCGNMFLNNVQISTT